MGNELSTLDQKLKQVLWACNYYWKSEPLPEHEKAICHSWVVKVYHERFGESFHPLKLRQLARLGFLEPMETARAGGRRYYRIVNPQDPSSILE